MQSNHNYKQFIPPLNLPTTLKPATFIHPPGKKACSISVSLNPEVGRGGRNPIDTRRDAANPFALVQEWKLGFGGVSDEEETYGFRI